MSRAIGSCGLCGGAGDRPVDPDVVPDQDFLDALKAAGYDMANLKEGDIIFYAPLAGADGIFVVPKEPSREMSDSEKKEWERTARKDRGRITGRPDMAKVQFDWDHGDCPLFYSSEGFPIDAPYEREQWPDIWPLISEKLAEDLVEWAKRMNSAYTGDERVVAVSKEELRRLNDEYYALAERLESEGIELEAHEPWWIGIVDRL